MFYLELFVGSTDNPHAQRNLQDINALDKTSGVSALNFGNAEKSEILIGRGNNVVQFYSLKSEQFENVEVKTNEVVGIGRCGDYLIAGFAKGQIQKLSVNEDEGSCSTVFQAGDDISHMRQNSTERHLIATGGKGRQNNLKVFDLSANGKQIFSSKNLPNDYLQLEVPIWDSDVGFLDDLPHSLVTCSRHGYVRLYDTRKQRRPVQCYATEDQMSFTSLAAKGNYIYSGTTMGALKAFDIRRMKTFVHTYKGFTGSISDLYLDETGKYLASASLDRYVRVHHTESCVMLYQCYVKSKATRVLLRTSMENPNNSEPKEEEDEQEDSGNAKTKNVKGKNNLSDDEEYDEMFDNMQTIG